MYIFMSERSYFCVWLPLENQACTLQTHVFSMCFRDFAQKHPTFSHLYYPSCSESVAFVGDPGRDLELWLPIPFDSWTESTPNERRISSVIGSGSFVGEGSLGAQCWEPWFYNEVFQCEPSGHIRPGEKHFVHLHIAIWDFTSLDKYRFLHL